MTLDNLHCISILICLIAIERLSGHFNWRNACPTDYSRPYIQIQIHFFPFVIHIETGLCPRVNIWTYNHLALTANDQALGDDMIM